MPIGLETGGAPLEPYQLQRQVEDAFVETQTLLDQEHHPDGGHGAITAESVGARTALVSILGGFRWKAGPWVLDDDGNPNVPTAAIRAPQITADQNDYAPAGIHSAIALELDADAAHTITGIAIDIMRRRLLKLINRSGYTITLSHNSGSSQARHRFSFGSDDFELKSGVTVDLYYDPGSAIWRGPETNITATASMIKTIQRSTVEITDGNTTATDSLGTSVSMAKTFISYLGQTNDADTNRDLAYVELISVNEVRATRNISTGSTIVSFEVVEFT